MPPPTAEPFATRVLLGPALRTQPDRRLVTLVRQGYETAFEEIVRRYRRPLDRFAAAIVGGRSEDVTQDAFSKALLALRGSDAEIELRPWLYRIVRNTALNDLRDRPPSAEELGETIPGGLSAATEAERREEMTELMERLRALPEPQRAAIVMRELEGLSHEEIAAALGVSGGAARQTIHRARTALRDGLGMLIPLPLLRMLFDHGAETAAAAGAGAIGGSGAALGGLGAGGAAKVGVAAVLIAGTVGTGVAIENGRGGNDGPALPAAAAAGKASPAPEGTSGRAASFDDSGGSSGSDDAGGGGDRGHRGEDHPGDDGPGDDRGRSGPGRDGSGDDGGRSGSGQDDDRSGSGSGGDDSSGPSGSSTEPSLPPAEATLDDDSSGSGEGSSGSGESGGDDD